MPGWDGTVSVDDSFVTLNVGFAVTMYGVSTTSVSAQSNGVSGVTEFSTVIILR